ncbi:Bgt-4568 [Blumeria graminis f. sp. tritici]|uniref:Bgt-4568 n=2 Tax=Blumeria graminis f. sp. tritici TaxID=62690 RepID=A0A061HDM2_BLUGR|nr:transmembrane protein [Blumeria graminis f. sp. tritici 96224]VDB83756.1 Bgt-4568 [Blumeria graminis f. sp. tritici]
MTFMKYVTPTLDNLLAWVDYTYYKKHEGETPTAIREGYYHNLQQYTAENNKPNSMSTKTAIAKFIFRFGKRAGISLFIFACSYVPFVGRLVLPGASFYTFQKVIGFAPAAIIFGTGIFLPRRYLVIFLQSYFSSRSLTRELLEPYFIRIHFTKDQKRNWFFDREGLLFGFGVGFYLLLRIPLLGVLMYGIAEASTAYLVTKITDPPPIPAQSDGFAASQQKWANKHEFLRLNLREIDKQLRHKRFADTPPNTTTKKAKN